MTLPLAGAGFTSGHDADAVIAVVRNWLVRSRSRPISGSARMLSRLLREPGGMAFLTEFVDGVIRPEDYAVAARAFPASVPGTFHFSLSTSGS